MQAKVMMDLAGKALTAEDQTLLAHPAVAGVIFFARNYESPAQITELVQSIRVINPELLIAVDHEGGRVQRFREGFSAIPPMRQLGEQYDQAPEAALIEAKDLGQLLASELRAVDIDFSFTPVLDLDLGISEVIGNRAFHSEPAAVIALASAFIEGLQVAGMACVVKHFPGHGSVAIDSHLGLPVDQRSEQDILALDAVPFLELLPTAQGVMPAHVVYSEVDPLPVGFSPAWLQQRLRQQYQFAGAIISDDLSMKATEAFGDMPARAQLASDAGCDLILICNDRAGLIETLETGAWENNKTVQQRLQALRGQ